MNQLCIISEFGTGENNTDGGLISFLDFVDMVHIKNSSKYLNQNIMLPATARLKINKRNLDSIFNTLLIYGSLVKTISLSYSTSTINCIKNCIEICPRLRELSISCVIVTQTFDQGIGIKNCPDKILTDQFLKSDLIKNLNQLIIYDSWIDQEILIDNAKIIIKSTISKCGRCKATISHKFDALNRLFWYEKKQLCDRCIRYADQNNHRRHKKSRWRTPPYNTHCVGIMSIVIVDKKDCKDNVEIKMNKAYKKFMRRKLNV